MQGLAGDFGRVEKRPSRYPVRPFPMTQARIRSRQKLGKYRDLVETVHSIGYRFTETDLA